ncbi:MAG TPA: ATP-binding protein [Thermomicrobiales bacterium]|nr:ATP-binding protein [Thermomicrobiales bacterium]
MRRGRGAIFRRNSIVADLALLIVVTLLPLIALGGYLSYRTMREERAAIYAAALRQAQETAQRADAIIGDTQGNLTILAQTSTLRQGDPAATRALLLDVKTRFPYYDDLFAADPTGTVYAFTAQTIQPPGKRVDIADQPYFQALLRDDRPVISDVVISKVTERPVVVVAVPVHQADDSGPPVGVVAATLDLVRLQQWLDSRTLPPRTTITVVDDRGRVLARSLDPEQWVGQTLAGVPIVRAAIRQHQGIVDGPNAEGVQQLDGFATARTVPWVVLVGIPSDAVYAPLRAEIRLMIARLVLVALATAVLALVVGRRVVRPIRHLTAGATTIAEGDLTHRIALDRRDELGRLATAMNRMADTLIGYIVALRGAQERLETAVGQVGHALTSAVEPAALLTPLVEAAVALTRADAGLLAFDDAGPPVVAGALDAPDPAGLAALLARRAAAGDGPSALDPADPAAPGLRGYLAAPVVARGEALGTLMVFRRREGAFSDAEERLLRIFADQAAVAIEQARLRTAVSQAEALRELHRLQSDFVATASHELRAPIAGIKGYAEVLLRDDLDLDAATRRDCLAGINRLADRLAAQVRAFFDAMRAGERRLGLRPEAVDLGALAASVVHSFAARVATHEFRLAATPDLPPALADPARVEDVLTNLLDNAVKYAPGGGPVTVTLAAADEETLELTVRDAGIGIPPEEQEHVFERFYRLDRSATRQAGGAGLGLYLCRAYVNGMGGRIWVESRPSAGSAFHVTLPIAPDEATVPPAAREVAAR